MKKTDIVKSNFSVTFVRALSGGDDKPWSLSIEEDRSGVLAVELRLSDEAFSRLMSGQAGVKAQGHLVRTDVHGMKRETVRRGFPVPREDGLYHDRRWKAFQEECQSILDAEGDGWQLREDTGLNHHRLTGGKYTFVLNRYVPWQKDDGDDDDD